ncbi:hypothetical protein C8R43DRAFT_1025125 [Mycena crocata]|nr:hypothetical protein C8R43DRAFT_1025125 [Mycena crocata]
MDEDVRCNCNAPAVQRTVTKESESKGRKFWTCELKGCQFFKWVDDPPIPSGSGSRSIPAKRSYPGQQDSGDGGPIRKCKCELTAVQKIVVKESANQGRKFWKCPNAQGAECGFFEWDDEAPRTNSGGTASSLGATNQPGGSRDQDVCYKCNLSGHWANACPNGEGSGTKRARSFSSKGDSNRGPTGACYKCNEEGHYSADCPGTGGTRAKPGQALTCFKCGEEGHFSNACTSDGGSAPRRSSSTRGTAKRGRSQSSSRGGGGSKRGRGKKRTFGVPS